MEPREFDCADCKRHIFSFGEPIAVSMLDTKEEGLLCATCHFVPGWFLDPVLAKTFLYDEQKEDCQIIGDQHG